MMPAIRLRTAGEERREDKYHQRSRNVEREVKRLGYEVKVLATPEKLPAL